MENHYNWESRRRKLEATRGDNEVSVGVWGMLHHGIRPVMSLEA